MRWAVLLTIVSCGPASPPESAAPAASSRPDPLALGWYLKGAVSEARGDLAAAERAHEWVDRLDSGAWADVHRGELLLRAGRPEDARQAFEGALARRPGMWEAQLGLGLAMTSSDPVGAAGVLEPLLPMGACRIATSGPSELRLRAEASCRGR
ncbi:MAG: tetratricopeptide repeat protein [Myxococcota bacterium]